MTGSWPLTDQHLAMLDGVLATENPFRDYLNKCKECEMNVDDELYALQTQCDWCRKVKAKFFPQAP
jgi:hypothetical protein